MSSSFPSKRYFGEYILLALLVIGAIGAIVDLCTRKPLQFETSFKPLFEDNYNREILDRENGELFVVVGPDFVVWADKDGYITASTTTQKPIFLSGEIQKNGWIKVSGNCVRK